jgi:hypothetical protein
MKTKQMLSGVVLAVLLSACKGGAGGDFEAFIKLDTDKAAAFAVGGKDCAAKAKSVGDWRAKNTANYKAMQTKLKAAFPEGPPKDVLEKHGTVMKANKKAVIDAMFDCTNDPAFSKMMDDTKSE